MRAASAPILAILVSAVLLVAAPFPCLRPGPWTLVRAASAQPADCAPPPQGSGAGLPLAIDLGGRPNVPRGLDGQVFVEVPVGPPGLACGPRGPPPDPTPGARSDVLRGPPGDVLRGPPGDVLRGPE